MRNVIHVSTYLAPDSSVGPGGDPNQGFLDLLEEAIRTLRGEESDAEFDFNSARGKFLQSFSATLAALAGTDATVRAAALARHAAFCEHFYNELTPPE